MKIRRIKEAALIEWVRVGLQAITLDVIIMG